MEIASNSYRSRSNSRTVEDLYLDRIVATQPELGPTVADGGYGWIIVLSAMIYNITIPSLFFLYGLIILKSIREEDHEEGERMKIWDVDLALVPIIMIVIKLVLDSWCRAIVKIFNMPRFSALAGLCLSVAGVILSSYSTSMYSNDHIINIFAGIFIGSGWALTSQQSDLIVSHYFRNKLIMVQRLVRLAPVIGSVLIPILLGYLCTMFASDGVIMIYGAILMQNCFFLAAYRRPVYKVIVTPQNAMATADDEDEVIFSNHNPQGSTSYYNSSSTSEAANAVNDEDVADNDVVVFKSKKGAKEIVDPEVEYQKDRADRPNRFSTDFTATYDGSISNRFSSDFSSFEIGNRISGYHELEHIDRSNQNTLPLYRETTINYPTTLVFPTEVSPGTARRTASLKKNFITVVNMLCDINFYLNTLLYLCITFSVYILGVIFPPMMWELNTSLNIWSVATLISTAHGGALCFVLLCVFLPNTINETSRLYAIFCMGGALGFYGITLSTSKSFLVVWCMIASLSTGALSVLQQPLHNALNEFDTTATMTTTNTILALVLVIWSVSANYEYRTYFFMSTILHIGAGLIFFVTSFRRRK